MLALALDQAIEAHLAVACNCAINCWRAIPS